jgi:hypothetical protein
VKVHIIDDLKNKSIEIVPSEGFKGLGIYPNIFYEEMNFSTLFYGAIILMAFSSISVLKK